MPETIHVGERLKSLGGRVRIGHGPYEKDQKVSWPLPYASDHLEIFAVFPDIQGFALRRVVSESDLVREGTSAYEIVDRDERNSHYDKENKIAIPTRIDFR